MSTAIMEPPVSAPLAPQGATLITELGTAALTELSSRKTLLAKLREEFTGLSCETKEGFEETHAAIMRLTKIRTSTEEKAAELKAGAKQWVDNVNETRDEILETAHEIEKPLRAMKEAYLAAIAREKQAKIDAERERLAAIERQKLAEEAAKAKAEQDRIAEEQRVERERLAAERAEMEAFKAEMAAAQKKLDDARAEQQREADKAKAIADAEAKAAQAKIDEQQRQLDEQRRKLQADKDAAEKAERDRLQAIEDARLADLRAKEAKERAEREAKEAEELAERQRVEAEERAKAEAERLEALKPDREKLAKWAAKITKAIEAAPEMATEEGEIVRDNTVVSFASAFKGLRVFCGVN